MEDIEESPSPMLEEMLASLQPDSGPGCTMADMRAALRGLSRLDERHLACRALADADHLAGLWAQLTSALEDLSPSQRAAVADALADDEYLVHQALSFAQDSPDPNGRDALECLP